MRNATYVGGQEVGHTELSRIPEGVRACVRWKTGEYDARRLRSQRDVIRDVMVSAADCDNWLTLGELRAVTRYGEASISAQLRHLRRRENGGYEIVKRHREGASPTRAGGGRARRMRLGVSNFACGTKYRGGNGGGCGWVIGRKCEFET